MVGIRAGRLDSFSPRESSPAGVNRSRRPKPLPASEWCVVHHGFVDEGRVRHGVCDACADDLAPADVTRRKAKRAAD